ncbi:autotransporter outer membrane beta-barrel domain-containing protein [Salmonella enterica subsp. enterica serovar Senftenberg]|uniref:autotransporter-associated beta strand repeat-containing protein n=1 Tax=Salmonella enterica TaxID=28901 RepID=UPI0011229E60|nr:autotransporter-associated beta strand repeat-containing protein [Salmonella enterica]EDC1110513.1 autotransporter outer membrane beta-barrel domain-containing protein [Salmonella enterica subsp. enterica serovar Senftenberg]EDC1124279.1 autotransporter outer membrane beta-barrel domain-containing protein [Salmonella enterica subsp. enterica serovar Senftenberg]EDC1130235.1 autotransporter outer membrane beta-barrel domain-containing protein [Salmonella enterica subsp. enterica serovar Senfte
MNKTYNIIWNAARGMYIVTSELARSGSRAIVSVSASCAVTLLAMDAAPAVAEETRVSIPSQTTTYTLSGATPFVVETGNTVATDTATSAAIVGDNSNDWDLLIESGAVVGSSLTDSQAMNLDSSTGATSVHNQGTITGSNEDGTIMLQNGGSVINDALIENNATYEHDPEDIPQEYAGVYMLNGGSYVSSESGVLEGVSGVIVQSGEAHITNGGMINSDGSWRSYGVEFRDGTYGTIVNTGTIITTASDGSNKIEDAAIYVHTLNDMAVSGSVSVDNSGLMQSDFITVALYHGSHFEVVNRVGGVITAGNSSLVGIKSTAMELKVGVDNLVTNDGTISAYGTANTYGIHYGESTSGGVITNTGSITTTGGGAGDASVYVHGNGDGTVVNNSGTMSSTVYGVYLDSARSKGHTLNNQAGGAISANTAVAINGNGNTISNQGKMTGVSDGLLISGNNNIVTTSGGEISGKNGIRVSKGSGNQITAKSGSKITTTSTGISIAGGNNQVTTESGSVIVAKDNGILINSGANNVTNGGSITATGSSISYGIQYNSGASGTITNTGTITTTGKGAGDASVYAHGGAVTINNSGTMDSSVFGVYVTTGHTLNNLAGGSITANTAVQLNGNNNTLANAGAILGDTNGVTISGSGNTLTSQGKITGGTNAVLINSGSKNNTLTLNTGTEISGSITDDNNSASANNNLILDGEGTLGSSISGLNSVTSSGDWTLSGATMNLSGTTNSALWVKSGTLILNGAMTAKGGTVDSGTTLQIGNGGTLGAFNGDIVDNGTLTFNRSDAAAYGSVISGSGNVVKQGGGELTLSNNNSYSGGTTIAEGTLTATAGGALGSGNIDNRAYLKLDAASASDPFIVADLTTHSGATVEIGAGSTLQANTLTQQDGSTLTADLTATSGPAIRAKNVNLDGTLNVASPASQEPIRSTDDLISLALIESDNAISGDFDDITINGNAMNPDAFITVVGQKNVNDTHYDLVETLTWYADRDNAAIDAHGTFNLADADDSFTVNTVLENVDANSGWNGQSLTKTGAGTLILNAENTYTGSTTISEGTLIATNVEALGTGNVTDNATLEMNTGGDFDNAISGSGQVVKSGDETLTLSGANSYTGGTTISGGTLVASNVEALGTGDITDNATLELSTGGDFANNIGGTGSVVKSGDKTLTLSGSNTYTGGTTISGGTLVATNVEALGTGNVTDNATLELSTGGDFANNIGGTGSVVKSGDETLTLSGANSYTGGTTISGGTLVATNVDALGTGDVTDNATLELNTGGDFDNAISGSGQVVKSGDKTLTLSGANSYSGATTISGGTLIATHVNALGTGAIDNRASLLLDASGQFTVTDLTTESGGNTEIGAGSTLQATTLTQKSDSTLTINLNSNTADPVIHAASQVSLAGTLDITGVGDVLDSDPASTDDLDTFTLIASDKTIAGDFEKLTVAGMDADLADFITVDGRIDDTGKQYELTTALTWYADRDDAVTDAHGTFNLTNADGSFAVNTVLENVDATLDPASATGWDGTSLIKQGAGTLILNAENTYTGGTTISGGTLVATNVDALGSGDVTDDATLELNTGGTFDNAISGSGQVVKSGDDVLTLSGANSYSGGTLISDGTLVASNVEALGSGDVTDNATLELNTGGTFDNAISGSGQVVKSGDETLTLSGSNTYTGGTLISGGTLVATNVEALGTGDVTDNAVLELNTGGDFINNIGGTGRVEKSGDDTLTLSGSNSYTGGTLISSGTLVATNVDALGSGDVTDNATLELNTGGTFDNAISGSGQVVKSGDETLTLSGANSYTGGTLISSGTLVANDVNALGTGDVTDNAVLELNTGGDFDNAISGSGQVVKSGDETLTLSGANSYTGGTLISGGTLVATNVEALGSGDVTDDATLELNTGGTFDNAISGSGQVVKSGDKMLTLSGANSYSGGTLISDGTLVASNVEALGTGDVTNNATLELNTSGDFTNNISGSGQVEKSGDDALTLSGANSYSGGTLISDGTLVASNVEALGSGDVTNNAVLELNTGGTFDNAISGSGQVVKSGDKTLTLSGANSYTGGTTINDGTLVATSVDALGTGDVTDDATLELNTGGDFDNAIGGSGNVVKSGADTLTLSGSNTYTGGTLISDGTLVASNVEALGTGDVTDNATLELNTGGDFDNAISGSGQVVKSGDETLTLSGANSYTGGTLISGGTLVATNVEALGTGSVTDNATLELNTSGTFDNVISGRGQVVKSGDKTLTLSGANSYTGGTTISGGTLVASNVEALGSGDIDNYASLQLNASGQFVTANLTTHDNAITAIGAGSALRANTLTQEANSTLAVHLTDSNSGAIVTADRANLGGTLDITGIGNVAKSWTRDAYAYTLIDTDSAINSDFAQFTVAGMDAKQVDFLTVDGRVNADDDTRYDVTASLSWYADSDNAATDAHGTFTLSEQGHSFTLNTALTDVDATLNPDSATYWDGKSLIKRGAGTLILGAQNTYSGDTDVQEGALWLAETATIGSAGSAQAVNIAANAAFGGHNATVNGHVNNLGNLYFVDTFTVNGDVVNSSAMISGSDQPNNTLTIAGNYTGNDGHLYLNTQLGDDSSPTDKLIVTGDTAGSTTLHITNVNGLGAQTVKGIEVIEVGGQSDGDFTLYKGHVDINAWTYTLKQDGGDWYLRSESDDVPDDGGEVTPPDDGGEVTPPDDGGEVTPPDDGGDVTPPDDGGDVSPPDDGGDVTPPDDGGDVTPPDDDGDITPPDGGDVTPVAPQYRADIGVYLGNQWMARNLQMQTLYDREGSQYRSADGSIWMRFKAGKAESQAVNGNVDIDSDYSQFQLGGDILTWSDGAQSVTVGLMGSYINASTDSTGNRGADGSQFSANGSVDGYNLGLYATWFADAQSHRGAYIDSWYQYGAYNNSVDNDGLSASRYDSAAHAVSLETGYRYDIALSNRNTVSLTPQAQVTWQRYSADTVIDDGGTRISGQNDDSWTTRLGVRVDGKLYKESGRIQPFMEVNWLHASDNASATFGDTKVSQDLPNDRVEVKVGIQANVSERLSVYAQAAGQKGKNDYGDASFSLNMRYNW